MGSSRALLVGSLMVFGLLFGLSVPHVNAAACAPGTFCGTIYFTIYSPGEVGKVSFTYDPSIPLFSLGTPTILNNHLPGGADGIVFDPQNGNLLIGSNTGATYIQEVDPSNGNLIATISSGTSTPLHMMVDPAQTTAWTSGIPGTPASIPLSPLSAGTGHALTGDDNAIDTIMWTDPSHAYYTSSGPGGFGHFGTISLTTYSTSCLKDVTGGCHSFPAAHGGTYDPYTGDLLIFGDSHVTQINATLPLSPSSVAGDFAVPSLPGALDQGTVDGLGHLFVGNNGGCLFFEDYASSKNVGTGTYSACPFLASNLDDVAPLVGAGAPPAPGVPEFPLGMMALVAVAVPALLLLKGRHAKVS